MKILNLVCIFFSIITIISCNKKISDDSPLSKIETPCIYFGTNNNKMLCLDANTGVLKWDFNTDSIANENVLIIKDTVYVADLAGNLYAINKNSGIEIWRKNYNSPISCGLSSYYDQVIVFSTFDYLCVTDIRGNILAVDGHGFGDIYYTSALPLGNKIYAMIQQGAIYEIDPYNPNLNWPLFGDGGIPTNFILKDDTLYSTDQQDGEVRRRSLHFAMLYKKVVLGGSINSSLLLHGGMIMVGCTDYNLYCIDQTLDYIRWKFKTHGEVNSSPFIDTATETVFVGSNDMNLYAINFVNGKLRWKYPTAGLINCSPIVYNGKVYFSSYDKYYYCVNIHTGKLVWKYNIGNISLSSPVIKNENEVIYPTNSGMSKY